MEVVSEPLPLHGQHHCRGRGGEGCISDMAWITLQGLLKTIPRNSHNCWGPFNGGKRVVGVTLQERWKDHNSNESETEKWEMLRSLG